MLVCVRRFEPDLSFVELINADPSRTWRAAVHQPFVGRSMAEVRETFTLLVCCVRVAGLCLRCAVHSLGAGGGDLCVQMMSLAGRRRFRKGKGSSSARSGSSHATHSHAHADGARGDSGSDGAGSGKTKVGPGAIRDTRSDEVIAPCRPPGAVANR